MAGHALLLLALLQTVSRGAGISNPNLAYNYSAYADQIKASIPLDKSLPSVPRSNRNAGPYGNLTEAGTDVAVQLRVFKVEAVDATSGSMDIKVWLRLSWQDDRLAWNPDDFGGVTSVTVLASDQYYSKMWIPDLTAYNSRGKFEFMFDQTLAVISSSGGVYWSRPGTLRSLCKFSGLVAFPFDRLTCLVDMGGWILGADYQGLVPVKCSSDTCGDGWTLENAEATSGESYQEYGLHSVSMTKSDYIYSCCTTPFPVLTYKFELSRSSEYYVRVLVIPQILLILLSFTVFFTGIGTSLGAGRMSFGMTIVLISTVMSVSTSSWLPVCGELLWVDLFLMNNMMWAYLALLESMIVVLLHGAKTPTLLPGALARRLDIWIDTIKGLRGHSVMDKNDKKGRFKLVSFAAQSFRQTLATRKIVGLADQIEEEQAMGVASMGGAGSDASAATEGGGGDVESLESVAQRLVFYESLYFRVDTAHTGWISVHKVATMLPFFEMSYDYEKAHRYLVQADNNGDGGLTRSEFVALCHRLLERVPRERLDMAATNYYSAVEQEEAYYSMKWQALAQWIEAYARHLVPSMYKLTEGGRGGRGGRGRQHLLLTTYHHLPLSTYHVQAQGGRERRERRERSVALPPTILLIYHSFDLPLTRYMVTIAWLFVADFTDVYEQTGSQLGEGLENSNIGWEYPGAVGAPLGVAVFTVVSISARLLYGTFCGTKTEAQMIAAALLEEQVTKNELMAPRPAMVGDVVHKPYTV